MSKIYPYSVVTMIFHALIICAFSAVAALTTEGVSWLLVYRKPEYKRLKKQIEKNHQIIEKLKREGKDEKRRQKMQKELQKDNTMLSGMKIYGMIFLSVVMLVLYQLLKQYYNGVVVAKLPFVPIALFRKLTHSGLDTDDFTDCSMVRYFFNLHFEVTNFRDLYMH